jgi:hypothetical protein
MKSALQYYTRQLSGALFDVTVSDGCESARAIHQLVGQRTLRRIFSSLVMFSEDLWPRSDAVSTQ